MDSPHDLAQHGDQALKTFLPVIFRIFTAWHLTDLQQTKLLGLDDEETLCNWRQNPDKASISSDLVERASYILGIYKSLQILLPSHENADRWLTTNNDGAPFNGRAPIERLMSGNMTDLGAVRLHLETVGTDQG